MLLIFQISRLPHGCKMQIQFLRCLVFFILIYCYSSQYIDNNIVGLGICCLDIIYLVAFCKLRWEIVFE